MHLLAAGVLLGTLLFQQLTELPHGGWLAAVLILAGFSYTWANRPAKQAWLVRLLLSFLLGFAWAHGYALLTEPGLLPEEVLGKPVDASGRVAGLVERQAANPTDSPSGRQRLIVALDRLETSEGTLEGHWRVRLSWYRAEFAPQPGQRLDLRIKLRPARNYSNPGSFDHEAWLYRQGIRYSGYVLAARAVPDAENNKDPVSAARQRISDRIAAALPDADSAGVLRALVVGDRSGIEPVQWQVFRRTGTNHLMAISGLHIGLVAGAVGALIGLLWRALPVLIARWPARQAAVVGGLGAALGYAMMAGFSLPTQRAVIMLAIAALGLLARRRQRWFDLYALAVVLVLLHEPSSVLSPGFWLSFGAVGAILLVTSPVPVNGWRGRLVAAVRIQLAIGFALAPALLGLGLGVPLLQVLVNLIAVPVFSLLLIPPALLGGLGVWLWPGSAATLLEPIAFLADVLLGVLSLADPGPGALFTSARPGPMVLLLGVAGVCLLLSPRGLPGRHLSPLLMLPLVLGSGRQAGPGFGDYRVHVLDVGQGLSTVVETAGHVLVFDLGPRFGSGFETGSRVVVPFLRELGRRRVDLAVLSHADIDHAGGLPGLLETFPQTPILAGEPKPGQRACVAGERWDWDDVRFEILHPPAGHALSGNDASCVIRVENAAGATLLTGDIEARVERSLSSRGSTIRDLDLVLAPHHGSATSSSAAFVAATTPDYVVFTAGYRNRYGFPRPAVIDRWRSIGAQHLNTAVSGQLSFEAALDKPFRLSREYRAEFRRYWHSRQ